MVPVEVTQEVHAHRTEPSHRHSHTHVHSKR
jgi:hypothetical protein